MNKLLNTLFVLAVASVTAHAQAPAAPAKPAVASIESRVAMCVGCHGIPGYQSSFPEVHRVPMISGQNAKYIAAALNAYKTGERKHPTMRGIAETLSEQDIADISAYYEKHAGTTGGAKTVREPSPQVAALLQKAACASCHGADYSKPIDPSYPKIAGQHSDYLFVALKAYKASNSANNVGRNNGVMGAIAKQFTNAELKALSGYIGSLEGDLRTRPDPKFR